MEILNENWDPEKIYTVYGTLTNGVIRNPEGSYKAVTYKSFHEQYEGVTGFFNLHFEEDVNLWVVFQCVPEDTMIN